MAQQLKNLPAMQEPQKMWFWFLSQKDPFKKEVGNLLLYSCFKNLMDREAWWATCPKGCKGFEMTEHSPSVSLSEP